MSLNNIRMNIVFVISDKKNELRISFQIIILNRKRFYTYVNTYIKTNRTHKCKIIMAIITFMIQ